MSRTEDEVRDSAKIILGFNDGEPNVKQGTGQITTFNQLGFKGIIDKPDGWYLPTDKSSVAIILETKAEKENIQSDKWISELKKNIEIVSLRYKRIVGILYNGIDVVILKFKDGAYEPVVEAATTLQSKSYYKSLFKENKIDKQKIYNLTKEDKRLSSCKVCNE